MSLYDQCTFCQCLQCHLIFLLEHWQYRIKSHKFSFWLGVKSHIFISFNLIIKRNFRYLKKCEFLKNSSRIGSKNKYLNSKGVVLILLYGSSHFFSKLCSSQRTLKVPTKCEHSLLKYSFNQGFMKKIIFFTKFN